MATSSEFSELYEHTCNATRKAQLEGDAHLKAVMDAVATITRCSNGLVTFNSIGLEKAYQRLTPRIGHKDAIIFILQFLVRIALLSVVLQTPQNLIEDEQQRSLWLSFLASLSSYLCTVGLWATVLVIHLPFWCRFRGNGGSILLIVGAGIWIGEGVTVLASCPMSTPGFILLWIHSTLMGILYGVPFCFQMKTRGLGFGLQVVSGVLLRMRSHEPLPAILAVGMGHAVGIALAYVLDQQSRAAFLRSSPRFMMEQILDLSPRRTLGGFAGGFAGVSGLKGTHASSVVRCFSGTGIGSPTSWR